MNLLLASAAANVTDWRTPYTVIVSGVLIQPTPYMTSRPCDSTLTALATPRAGL